MGNYKKLFIVTGALVAMLIVMSIYLTSAAKDDGTKMDHDHNSAEHSAME